MEDPPQRCRVRCRWGATKWNKSLHAQIPVTPLRFPQRRRGRILKGFRPDAFLLQRGHISTAVDPHELTTQWIDNQRLNASKSLGPVANHFGHGEPKLLEADSARARGTEAIRLETVAPSEAAVLCQPKEPEASTTKRVYARRPAAPTRD